MIATDGRGLRLGRMEHDSMSGEKIGWLSKVEELSFEEAREAQALRVERRTYSLLLRGRC